MMSRDDTELAFPSDRFGHTGMSLRDYFAGQALAGHDMECGLVDECLSRGQISIIAFNCYAIADAMMKERKAFSDGE